MINLPEERKIKAIGTFEIEGLEEVVSLMEIADTHKIDWNKVALRYGGYLASNPQTAYEETKKYINRTLEDRMK